MRVLIVDDEPLARERIRTLLSAEPDIELVGEANDGASAVSAIRTLSPELVFLDVQMPEMDGFAVLEQLSLASMPAVIFVTAFDRYAIKAFEVCALDYLLKPFDRERFSKAVERARSASDIGARVRAALEKWNERPKFTDRLVVRSGGRVFFLRVEEVDWIEAAGNYVRLHSGGEEHLYRETMSRMEAILDPARFARIHRSAIVNIDCVKELHPLFRGDYQVVLRNGRKMTLHRSFRARLLL